LEPIWLVSYFGLGAFAGVLAGMLGIGGGMIMVPFMAMLFTAQGHPYATLMQVALATSMATIIFTSISSMRAHHKNNNVRWDLVRAMVPGMLLGCLLGATVLSNLPTKFIKLFFSLFLIYSATKMLRSVNIAPTKTLPAPAGLFRFSIIVGVLSTMVGAGGGFVTIPFMTARGINGRLAIGTSSAFGLPLAIFGTVGYIINGWNVPNLPTPHFGYIFLPALLGFAIASVIGAPFGAKLTQKLPIPTLKRVFAYMLYLLAARMMWMTFYP
jgi:uncharacterized protein